MRILKPLTSCYLEKFFPELVFLLQILAIDVMTAITKYKQPTSIFEWSHRRCLSKALAIICYLAIIYI